VEVEVEAGVAAVAVVLATQTTDLLSGVAVVIG